MGDYPATQQSQAHQPRTTVAPRRRHTQQQHTSQYHNPRTPHRHMGTASDTADYLPPAPHQQSNRHIKPPRTGHRAQLKHERYVQTVQPGKSIFLARKKARATQIRIIVGVCIVAVAVLVWFFLLR